MTTLTIENALAGELPEGFQTTLAESDRLRELNDANLSMIGETVEDWGNNTLTERDIIRAEVQKVLTSFQTPDTTNGATLELPATALEFKRIQRFAAKYKENSDTPSGTIKSPKRANTDDIVFTFANPEVYDEISGNAQDTFEITGVTSGNRVEVIGDSGLNVTNPTNGTSLSLDDDEQLYFTGDYIDLSTGKSVLSKIEWQDIDGEDYGPDDLVLMSRLSPTHVMVGQGAWVKSTLDLDAKAYQDGDAELIPVAFYMAGGDKAPTLV